MQELTKDYVLMWKYWSDFKGKTSRGSFWMAILVHFIVSVIVSAIVQLAGGLLLIQSLYGLLVIVPSIAIGIRRLHDTNRSGWNLLWIFLPVIGWIILLYQLVQ